MGFLNVCPVFSLYKIETVLMSTQNFFIILFRDNGDRSTPTPKPIKKYPQPPNQEKEEEEEEEDDDDDREQEEVTTSPSTTVSTSTVSSSLKTTVDKVAPTPSQVETQSYVTPVPQRETPPLLHFNTEQNVTPAVYEPEGQENRDMDEYVTQIQQESEDTINKDIEDSTSSSSSSKEINSNKDYTMDYLLDKFFNITKPYEDQYSG